jgi:hypothetical protein
MFTQNEERLLRFKTYTFLVLLGGVALSIACFSYLSFQASGYAPPSCWHS